MNEPRFHGWRAIVAIVMLTTGAACFILACVTAMVTARKD
jgi:hypothetical protein